MLLAHIGKPYKYYIRDIDLTLYYLSNPTLKLMCHVCGVASKSFFFNKKCPMPPSLVVNQGLQDCTYVVMVMNSVPHTNQDV